MKITFLTAAILLPAAVTIACGADAQDPDPTSPPRPAIELPFDTYKLDRDDLATADAAQTALLRECMATKGFAWTRPRTSSGENALLAGNARRYGLADSNAAQRHGYHVPDDPAQARYTVWADQLSNAERTALFDPGGCLDQADNALWKGAGNRDLAWLTGLEYEAVERSAQAPAVASAITAWRDCMRESGLDYRTPQDAVEDPRWNLDAPEVSPAERAVAAADVRCKEQTDLIPTRAAAERRIQTEMIRQNATRFDDLRQSNDRYVHNAHQILNGSGR